MKTLLTTVAAAAMLATSAMATVMPSTGLHTLATTGWADEFAMETGGMAFDHTGGVPGMFTYTLPEGVSVDLSVARGLLSEGECR